MRGLARREFCLILLRRMADVRPDLVADAVVECQARSDKPVLAYVSPHAPHIVRLLNRRGIPAFAAPSPLSGVIVQCSASSMDGPL